MRVPAQVAGGVVNLFRKMALSAAIPMADQAPAQNIHMKNRPLALVERAQAAMK